MAAEIPEVADGAVGVWLVVGEAGILVERTVERLLDEAGADRAGFDTGVHRGSDAGIDGVLADARTPPFLAARRILVVRDLQAAPDRFFQSLLDYLDHPSPTTMLVLAGTGWPKVVKGGRAWNQVIPKAVEAVGRVVRFSPADLEPVDFAMGHARRCGARLGRDAARRLVGLVGQDLGRIALEVEKVATYVDEGAEIDAAAVDAACSALAEEAAWALSNAMQGGDARRALTTLARALDEGTAPEALFHQVARPTRVVLRIAAGLRRGIDPERMQRELGLPPRAFREALMAAKAHSVPAVEVLERVARGHRAMHTSRAGDDHTLEALVVDLLVRSRGA